MLSKSKYLRGVKCARNLWLYTNKKEEQHYSEANIRIFNRGTSVGELAQAYFPDGKFAVEPGEWPTYDTARLTQEYIQQGVETIYEATFIYDNTIVAVDLLHKEEDGWHLYEVKSTNSCKTEHVKDVAVQYYVLKGCGMELADASVMYFDRSYVKRGDIDVHQLFTYKSVLSNILPMQEEIEQNISVFLDMVKADEPCIEMGKQCDYPYECEFKDYCRSLLPPAVEEEKKSLSNEAIVNSAEVKRFLDKVNYPICHLDFETIRPGVPLFDESRPYQQITFQFSIHIKESPTSELVHYEYLAPNDLRVDPRIGLIQEIISHCRKANTVIMYSHFEKTQIKKMIHDFPEYASELEKITSKLWDLMAVFRSRHYYTESMQGSYSIKKVLPALCPALSYSNLEINNGLTASDTFMDLYYSDDSEYINETRANLLRYCHLDTLAMVKVLEVLEKV